MGASAASPGLERMADGGRYPTDRPKTRRATRQECVAFVPKLCPVECALASATLADEYALFVCHNPAFIHPGLIAVPHGGVTLA
jgi:hypothetical protein